MQLIAGHFACLIGLLQLYIKLFVSSWRSPLPYLPPPARVLRAKTSCNQLWLIPLHIRLKINSHLLSNIAMSLYDNIESTVFAYIELHGLELTPCLKQHTLLRCMCMGSRSVQLQHATSWSSATEAMAKRKLYAWSFLQMEGHGVHGEGEQRSICEGDGCDGSRLPCASDDLS